MAPQPKQKNKAEVQSSWLDDLGELPGDLMNTAGEIGTGIKEAFTGRVDQPDQSMLPPVTKEFADSLESGQYVDASYEPGIEIGPDGQPMPDYQNMDPDYLDAVAQSGGAGVAAPGRDPKKEAERMRQAAAQRRAQSQSYPDIRMLPQGQVAGR